MGFSGAVTECIHASNYVKKKKEGLRQIICQEDKDKDLRTCSRTMNAIKLIAFLSLSLNVCACLSPLVCKHIKH